MNNFHQLAADFLEMLESAPHFQHGIALMLWDTFLHTPFQKLIDLLSGENAANIVGGGKGAAPPPPMLTLIANKDRVLRRDVLVGESEVSEFVASVRRTLSALAHASTRIEATTAATAAPHRHTAYEAAQRRLFTHPKAVELRYAEMFIGNELTIVGCREYADAIIIVVKSCRIFFGEKRIRIFNNFGRIMCV